MTREQALILAASLLGGSLYLYNIDKINNILKRTILLASTGKNFFIDSENIKKQKEKLTSDIILTNINEKILEQFNLFKTTYTKEELIIFKNNLNTIKFDQNFQDYNFQGQYNPYKNAVSTNPESVYVLNHEMHHVASNLGIVNGIMCTGFRQSSNKSEIGRGLNEGYTEYLSKIMTHKQNYGYKKTVDIIPLIEECYGNKIKLRQLYFNADLPSVIKKFEEVFTTEESLKLIIDIDKLWIHDQFPTWFNKAEILELSIRIRLYDYYKKISGNTDKELLFLDENMLEKISTKSKILK